MTRPLYKAAVHEPKKRSQDGHAGLWFDKFCNKWRKDGEIWTLGDGKNSSKLHWINELTGSQIGDSRILEEHTLRMMRLIERRRGCAAVFTTESRFVTGLGRSHPVENGFAWHPTLGTPYLPGSSVKGLVCAWARTEVEPKLGSDSSRLLFGSVGTAGSISFTDALPISPVHLDADVMTPHYAGWSKHEPPGDWMSPKPIPFLTVAAETQFLFALVPVRDSSDEDLKAVEGWLGDALAWAGGGAKTAVGYGRFRRDKEMTRFWTARVKEELRQWDAIRSPTARWRLELEAKTEAELLDQIRIHLEKERLMDPADCRAFADAVLELRLDWVERWRLGMRQDQRTSVGGKKLKERARLLDNAVAETTSDADNEENTDQAP